MIDWSQIKTAEQKAEEQAKAEQEELNREARAYLASTDWYVVRQQETGQPVPSDVQAMRSAARAQVIE